jgi:hypothetical protein
MKIIQLAGSVGIVASVAVLACGKSDPAPTGAPSASSAPAASAPAAAASTAPGAAAALPLSGSCTTKAGPRVLGCTEYYGKLPDGAADGCKKDGGTFTAGATACSTDSAIGKCAHTATATANQIDVAYKTSVGDAKGSCTALGNTWTGLGK